MQSKTAVVKIIQNDTRNFCKLFIGWIKKKVFPFLLGPEESQALTHSSL